MATSTVLGRALTDYRTRTGATQGDIGRKGHVDHSLVSAAEHGRRRLAPDVTRRLAEQIDDARLILAAAEDATAGAESPWLDGPAADLSRVAVWAKTLEELREAHESGQQALPHACRAPAAATAEDVISVRLALTEIVEAITASRIAVAIACREYGLSYRALWQEHRRELYRSGYWSGHGRAER